MIDETNGTFDWRRFQGHTLALLLNEHPWTTGLQPYLADFEAQTGIQTNVTIVPEPDYFQVMETTLQDGTTPVDVFCFPMDSTAYRLWQGSLLQPLTPLLNDTRLTEPSYNFSIFPKAFG